MWVALGVVVVLLGSMGAATYVSYTNGEQWKDSSQEWQARAGDLREQLTSSEADAEALQVRLGGLANEKAQAQDERNAAETERDLSEGLATLATAAAVDVAACQAIVSDALTATISQLGSEIVAWEYLESMVSQIDTTCGVAEQSYQQFADAVNSL